MILSSVLLCLAQLQCRSLGKSANLRVGVVVRCGAYLKPQGEFYLHNTTNTTPMNHTMYLCVLFVFELLLSLLKLPVNTIFHFFRQICVLVLLYILHSLAISTTLHMKPMGVLRGKVALWCVWRGLYGILLKLTCSILPKLTKNSPILQRHIDITVELRDKTQIRVQGGFVFYKDSVQIHISFHMRHLPRLDLKWMRSCIRIHSHSRIFIFANALQEPSTFYTARRP